MDIKVSKCPCSHFHMYCVAYMGHCNKNWTGLIWNWPCRTYKLSQISLPEDSMPSSIESWTWHLSRYAFSFASEQAYFEQWLLIVTCSSLTLYLNTFLTYEAVKFMAESKSWTSSWDTLWKKTGSFFNSLTTDERVSKARIEFSWTQSHYTKVTSHCMTYV